LIGFWNVEKKVSIFLFGDHKNDILQVAHQNDVIFSGGKDRSVKIWTQKQITSKKEKNKYKYQIFHEIQNFSIVKSILVPIKELVFIGGSDGVLKIYEFSQPDGKPVNVYQEKIHDTGINCMVQIKQHSLGNLFVSVSCTGELCLWRFSGNK